MKRRQKIAAIVLTSQAVLWIPAATALAMHARHGTH